MEKTHKMSAEVILSKTKDGCEKVLFNISLKSVLNLCLCILFSSAGIFSGVFPFGIAFYTSVFTKKGWLILYLASCISFLFFKIPTPLIYIASLTLITAFRAVFDFKKKYISELLSATIFFALKLCYIIVSGFVFYDFFSLVIESSILFLSVIIFEKGWTVIADITKRNYISSLESICAVCFLSALALSLSSFPSIAGFGVASVFSVFLIYVFSLSGLNGEAVCLGVLLALAGTLKSGDFADISAGFPFGALMASVFAHFGRIAVVLGFTIANTIWGIIIADASLVAALIYDSLMAAFVFMLTPQKLCVSVADVFKKNRTFSQAALKNNRISDLMSRRLEEMSTSFRELSEIYDFSTMKKELGYEYVISKFRQITSTACVACPLKTDCFKKKDSKGYRYMGKMLETAFKNGKISPETMPSGFKSRCSRQESFCREFNLVFSLIKTEKMWLTKLNDSRMLISDQLLAVADTISEEKERCISSIDVVLEENLRSEMDKASINPLDVVAEKDSYGDFCISLKFKEAKLRSDTLCEISKIIFCLTGKKANCSSPVRNGETVSYTFSPARSFSASVGYASGIKTGEEISGDSFSFLSSDGNNIHIILSDGMGSGENAKKESKLTVDLLEKFLKAGFKSDIAVKLINSSLLLKSSKDVFSTIDLCSLNLYNASVSFTKLGAASSYIKSEGEVTSVKSASLPAGIVREIDVEKHFLSITGDTVILIMSDGISDISLKYPVFEGWIEKELETIDTTNPQIIASKIMKKARQILNEQIYDDMTVIAVSVKKV